LSSKDDKGHVHFLLVGHRGVGMGGKSREVFNGVEDEVDWLGDVEVKIVDVCFGGADLLGSDLPIGGEQVGHDIANAAGVLACSTVEEGTEVDGVDGVNNLGYQSLFGRLAELKLLVTFCPDSSSGLELSRSTGRRRCKRTWIGWSDPWMGRLDGGIGGCSEDETEMTMEATTKGGGDGSGVGFELGVEQLKCGISGFPMDLGQQLVLKVGVFDTRNARRQHG
jgi:hypothetical protein